MSTTEAYLDLHRHAPVAMLDHEITDRRAWTRETVRATDWTVTLGDVAITEVVALAATLDRQPLPVLMLSPDQFALVSQEVQLVNAVCDSSGFCQFIQPTLDDIREYYGHFVGRDISREEIADQGWQVLMDEWEFNRRAGFTAADDVLPQCMKEDAIGPNKVVFDVSPEIIADAKVRKAGRDKLYTTKAAG